MGGRPNSVNPVANNPRMNPNANQNVLIPPFPKTALTNQELMYMLANGTGGFVIINTNDLAGGMDKIAKELNEYYLLGYTPPESKENSCHALRVKLEKAASMCGRAPAIAIRNRMTCWRRIR